MNMAKILPVALALCMAAFLSGCSSIPSNSPMSKIHKGMTRGEVIEHLDAPNDIKQITSWRNSLLPWETVNDYQTIYYYNGLGEISFNRKGKQVVQSIDYNPYETGLSTYN